MCEVCDSAPACVVCDKQLPSSHLAIRKVCSRECLSILDAARRVAKASNETTPCLNCESPVKRFVSSGRRRKYCSTACRHEHQKSINREKPKVRHCEWCNEKFETRHSQEIYCSLKCERRGYRRRHDMSGNTHEKRCRKSGAKFEPINPAVVFQRDRWVCQLCLARIDPDLKWPDPGSGTIDHRVPLSAGGDHVLENLQAAHAACNIQKNNREELFDGTEGASPQVARTSRA